MKEKKVISYLGIIISANAIYLSMASKIEFFWIILITFVTIIVCFILSFVEEKIRLSNYSFFDRIHYCFSRNKHKYVIEDKIIEYRIKDEKNATYSVQAKAKIVDEKNFVFNGRYHWEQDENINIELNDAEKYKFEVLEDMNYTNVPIRFTSIPHKKEKFDVKFTLTNLRITHLKNHSHLSCRVFEKIKKLKLVAYVDKSLNPSKTATLIIFDSCEQEIEIPEKEKYITLNTKDYTYEKIINFPRAGRKYCIKWQYNDNEISHTDK